MSSVTIYFLGIVLTLLCCFLVVWYLRRKLYKVLVELTGTEDRADFWMSFSNVLLILVPLVFAMTVYPNSLFGITNQFKWGIVGLIVSLVVLGLIMVLFIGRREAG